MRVVTHHHGEKSLRLVREFGAKPEGFHSAFGCSARIINAQNSEYQNEP